MPRLEARNQPSLWMTWLSPFLAVVITLTLLAILLAFMDKDIGKGLYVFLVEPFVGAGGFSKTGAKALAGLALKATPLILCSLGLALCFRANIFNIGAEGQYIIGAIFSGGVALWFTSNEISIYPWLFLPIGMLAGALGGMLWASIVAALKDFCNANEILVSLMLVYVAGHILKYLMFGPWQDPNSFGFPVSTLFSTGTTVPRIYANLHLGFVVALILTAIMWVLVTRTYKGYQFTVGGVAPDAARYAGFSARRALWSSLLISGALAGLAGSFETLGNAGLLTSDNVSVGYGFTAIIVAYIARLHPVGCVFGSFLLSIMLIGGELAQTRIGMPASFSQGLQGTLLFALLACDTLIAYRLRMSLPSFLKRIAFKKPKSAHAEKTFENGELFTDEPAIEESAQPKSKQKSKQKQKGGDHA